MKPKSGVSSKGFFLIVIYWVSIAPARALKGIFGSISFFVVFCSETIVGLLKVVIQGVFFHWASP